MGKLEVRKVLGRRRELIRLNIIAEHVCPTHCIYQLHYYGIVTEHSASLVGGSGDGRYTIRWRVPL